MHAIIFAGVIATGFTTYPSSGDKVITVPRAGASNPHVEVMTDKGPIVEMVIRCRKGTAIISYSKMEKLFCTPKLACGRNLTDIAAQGCG